MKKQLTLCFIHDHPRILLGFKKRGFGASKWNGFGGKVERGETHEGAVRRETKEESGVEVSNLEKVGIIEFEFPENPELLEVHIFKTSEYSGEPKETEEMRPQWFMIDEIPFRDMWADDVYWFPLLLQGKKFRGRFIFDEVNRVREYDLEEVDTI